MTVVFDPLRLAEVAWDVGSANAQTPLAIERRQRERLTALLDSPGGVRWLQACMPGREADGVVLQDLPVMHKRERMAHFEDWVADPALRLPQLLQFTADPANIARAFLGRYHVWVSSGTSGEPALFVQDARTMAVYDALESLRRATPSLAMGWPDLGMLGQRIAFVGATSGHFASVVSLARLAQVNPWLQGALRTFSFLQPLAELVAALNDWRPSLLSTYPSMAWVLAEERAAGRLRIAPREVWTGGETLTPALRRALAQRFGVAVRDTYGASECLEIASECRCGALHLHADWVILEPVDARLRPVPEGEAGAAALLTNLANRVQPIVRYVLGDRVRYLPGACDCGSALPRIEVQGRDDELLSLRGRGRRPVHLAPLALVTVLEEGAGVFDFELRQTGPAALCLTLYGAAADAADAAGTVLRRWLRLQGVERLQLDCVAQPGSGGRGRSGKRLRVRALEAASAGAG